MGDFYGQGILNPNNNFKIGPAGVMFFKERNVKFSTHTVPFWFLICTPISGLPYMCYLCCVALQENKCSLPHPLQLECEKRDQASKVRPSDLFQWRAVHCSGVLNNSSFRRNEIGNILRQKLLMIPVHQNTAIMFATFVHWTLVVFYRVIKWTYYQLTDRRGKYDINVTQFHKPHYFEIHLIETVFKTSLHSN